MYFVKYGKDYLHDPRVDGRVLFDLSLDCEENSCGFCDFTIYPNHPLYGQLRERDADNPIEVYDDEILLFAGFIYELGKEFYLDGHVKCKGELDYLSESIIRPYSTFKKGYGSTVPTTVNGYFEWLINQHNNQADANKQFKIGVNQGAALDPNNYLYRESTEYPRTFDEIKNKLLFSPGGFITVRHQNGVRYIDYLAEWSEANSQILDFGVNLTDYTQTDDSAEVCTYVVPLGARMSQTDYSYNDGYFKTIDTTVSKDKEYFTKSETDGYYSRCSEDMTAFESGVTYYEYNYDNDESDLPLTIAGSFDGSVADKGYVKSNDMVYCLEAVQKYGWIGLSYKNTDITLKKNLMDAGVIALKEQISPKRTIEIKAVDMHLVNPDINPIRIGEHVRVRSVPHNLDSYFLCVSIDLDLNNPENSLYTLGTTFDTLTGQQNKRINDLNATINKQYEESSKIYEESKNGSSTAADAKKKADSAYSESLKATADAIDANKKADDATAKVELIQTTVTEVKGNTDKAMEDAAAAAAKAAEAEQKAIESATASGEATAIANEIKSQIDDVKGDAASLRDGIDQQIETKTSTMTAGFAKKTDLTDTETTLRSEITQSATTVKSEVEQMYVKKTELTDVETDLHTSITQNADSIRTTAEEVTVVKTDLTAAQAAADKAKELADAAQEAADNAGSGAVAAQAIADEAKRLADEAQANLSTLDAAVAVKFSDVKHTTDGIESTVGEVKTKFDHLTIGGRNLYRGTRNFDGDKWHNLDQWEAVDQNGYEFKEYRRTGAWQGIYQEINAKEGELYIFSFLASGDENTRITVYTDWENTATTPPSIDIGPVSVGSYTRYSAAFTANVDGIIKARVENSVDGSLLQICALKLEKGNVATDWTPAPEDGEYAIESAKSSIKQNADSIATTVETMGEHGNKISQLEQTSEGFSVKLDNLQVGGRNLLSATDDYRVHTGTGLDNECSFLYNFTPFYNNLPSLNGKQMVMSFDWETTATSGTFRIELNQDPWTAFSIDIPVTEGKQSGSSVYVVTCDEGIDTGSYWGVQLRSDYLTGDITIKNLMIEVGNKPSSWRMAPEDTAWFIGEAHKEATNYLGYTSAGLVVGDMTEDVLGKNVCIDKDSVDIRNGDTVMASFAEDSIDFKKQAVFTADGILINNGDAYANLGRNNVLWSSAAGYYMQAGQEAVFATNLSRQITGAVFCWCGFQNGVPTNSNWKYFFVPKQHVIDNPGCGICMGDPYLGMMKYIYVSNGGASGHANNSTSGTTNGIAWNNKTMVLRYVLGV